MALTRAVRVGVRALHPQADVVRHDHVVAGQQQGVDGSGLVLGPLGALMAGRALIRHALRAHRVGDQRTGPAAPPRRARLQERARHRDDRPVRVGRGVHDPRLRLTETHGLRRAEAERRGLVGEQARGRVGRLRRRGAERPQRLIRRAVGRLDGEGLRRSRGRGLRGRSDSRLGGTRRRLGCGCSGHEAAETECGDGQGRREAGQRRAELHEDLDAGADAAGGRSAAPARFACDVRRRSRVTFKTAVHSWPRVLSPRPRM